MNPSERRLLGVLVEYEKVLAKDLRKMIGSNPIQAVANLRRQGWNIRTNYISVKERVRLICQPNYYWLEDTERERARCFLSEEPHGVEEPTPLRMKSQKNGVVRSAFRNNDIKGG